MTFGDTNGEPILAYRTGCTTKAKECRGPNLGVAIREGQDRGEILAPGQKNFHAGGHGNSSKKQLNDELKPGPTNFAAAHELSGANKPGEGIYGMTDNVSDEQFEEAITEARAEEV